VVVVVDDLSAPASVFVEDSVLLICVLELGGAVVVVVVLAVVSDCEPLADFDSLGVGTGTTVVSLVIWFSFTTAGALAEAGVSCVCWQPPSATPNAAATVTTNNLRWIRIFTPLCPMDRM